MGFAEELDAIVAPTNARPLLPKIVAGLDEKDREDLKKAILDPDVNSKRIHTALRAMGVSVSESTCKAWKRGDGLGGVL